MKHLLSTFILFIACYAASAQQQRQTISGHIYDEASGAPLTGVVVLITDLKPEVGTTSDSLGNFILDSITIGRHNLKFIYMTYEDKVLVDQALREHSGDPAAFLAAAAGAFLANGWGNKV